MNSLPSSPPANSEDDRPGVRWKTMMLFAAVLAAIVIFPKGRLALLLVALSVPLHFLYALLHAIVAGMLRVPCIGLGIGFGPAVAVITFGRCSLSVGSLPTGSYAKFADEHQTTDLRSGERRLDQLSPVSRLAILFAAPVGMLLVAMAFLGGTEAWHSFLRSWGQILEFIASPRSAGRELLLPFLQAADGGDYRYVLGTIAVKSVATNLLPVGTVTGGAIIVEILSLLRGRRLRSSCFYETAGILLLLAGCGFWLFAVYTAFHLL